MKRTAMIVACLVVAMSTLYAAAQEQRGAGSRLRQPVYRVANNTTKGEAGGLKRPERHPLDPALELAREKLQHIHENVHDYTCVLVKRERIKGELGNKEYMFAKIRNRKMDGDKIAVPLSAYMYFMKPQEIAGREVLYVEGKNNGKMIAHEGGKLKFAPSVWLRPDGVLAMRGNLYPITEIGIENLVVKLIEKGVRDRNYGECEVNFRKNATINGRVCTLIEVKHPVRRDHFDFHIAHIFIDDELHVPIRYAAFDWPAEAGGSPQLLEEYTYLKLKLNEGLTDNDFDHKNAKYGF